MLDLTDVARVATLLIPPFAVFATLCAFLARATRPGRGGSMSPLVRAHAAAGEDMLPGALLAAASMARAAIAAAAVLAAAVLFLACTRSDRSFTVILGVAHAHRDAGTRLLALATTGQGAVILALLLLGLVGIAPARLIAVTTATIGAPLLAAVAGCLSIWPLDPFIRSVPIVERTAADPGTQYGVALLASGAMGMCVAVCLRPVLRAAHAAQPGLAAGSDMPLSRAQRLAAIEREVREARVRGEQRKGSSALATSGPASVSSRPATSAASHCTRCQAPLPNGAEYCTACQHPVARATGREAAACTACGTSRESDDRFCARCGTALAVSTAVEGRAPA